MDNRIITTDVMEEDFSLEGNLRPQTLDEYIGQEKTKNPLKVYIEASSPMGTTVTTPQPVKVTAVHAARTAKILLLFIIISPCFLL